MLLFFQLKKGELPQGCLRAGMQPVRSGAPAPTEVAGRDRYSLGCRNRLLAKKPDALGSRPYSVTFLAM